jgi:hypothetical protein
VHGTAHYQLYLHRGEFRLLLECGERVLSM